MIWISSDLHFGHSNLCKSTSKWADTSRCRDFNSLNEMNRAIVSSINSVVKSDDTLYHLGDWSFGGEQNIKIFRDQINCGDVRCIRGNHDQHLSNHSSLFTWIKDYHELSYNKTRFILFHYAMRVWNKSHHSSILCYGHSHGTLPGIGRSLDVGWDIHKRPLSVDEIIKMMEGVQPHIVDHHNQETIQ